MQTPTPDDPRFLPGAIIADRYRVVAMLGRGGMGEVYRAHDLTLGQEVALKFLPVELAASAEHLERFLAEVRVARQVSHPNVCRVHDVGEVDGQHYISMEYVDGEDLASLLRRIGRLPQDKAGEIAQQLCAGVAAAHDQGILHRDLKPANVMIDGDGGVRVADFGLAAIGAELTREDARVGTPAYMAPEQLAGEAVSEQSDIFALGLVLFEVFTGRPAFKANTFDELLQQHSETNPQLTTHLPDIDPATDAVIRRCLARNPSERPRSAREVAGGLPGGDPLAAAIAAGETPSPELIAAAGGGQVLPQWVAIALTAVVVVGFWLIVSAESSSSVFEIAAPELPPQVLEHRAMEVAEALGYGQPGDSVSGFDLKTRTDLIDHGADDPWRRIRLPRAEAVRFWYRQSPWSLMPEHPRHDVTFDKPRMWGVNMVSLVLLQDGRLNYLVGVGTGAPAPDSGFDFAPAFELAGLDIANFTPADARFVPPTGSDRLAEWTGPDPTTSELTIVVQAAALGDRLTYFNAFGRWDIPDPPPRPKRAGLLRGISSLAEMLINCLMVFGAAWFGWRNLQRRRGDRRNAFRIATLLFVLSAIAWVLGADHATNVWSGLRLVLGQAHEWLWIAMLGWLMYLALEPSVRSIWPQKLVSWTRLLSGTVRDVTIGRDVLIGLAGGVSMEAFARIHRWIVGGLGDNSLELTAFTESTLEGPRHVLANTIHGVWNAGIYALLLTFLFVLFKAVLRRASLAVVALYLVGLAQMPREVLSNYPSLDFTIRVVQLTVLFAILFRAGTVALVVSLFTVEAISSVPLTLDFDAWHSGASIVVATIFGALAVFGYVVSTRPSN